MMEQWNFSMGLIVIFILVLGVIIILIEKRNKHVENQWMINFLQDIPCMKTDHYSDQAVLFLSPDSSDYAVLDDLLSEHMKQRIVVIFKAPVWLVNAKSEKWKPHKVIDYANHPSCRIFDSKLGHVLISNKYKIKHEITATVQWIKENNSA